jgi:hypothetical protein
MAKVGGADLRTQLPNTENRERAVELMTTVQNTTSLEVYLSTNPEELRRKRTHRPNLETELDRADPVWNGFNNGRWTSKKLFVDPEPDLDRELQQVHFDQRR